MKGRFWTGSKVVLGYITNNVQQLRTFFANGVEQIKDKLHQVNDTTFQLKNSCRWRIIRIECWSVEFWQSLVLRSFFFGQVETSMQRFQMTNQTWMKILHLAVHYCLEDIIASLENRFSNWLMLKRVIALVLLYMKKLLESAKTNKEPLPEVHKNCREKLIGLKEMQTAEMEIIKSVQSNYIVFLSK